MLETLLLTLAAVGAEAAEHGAEHAEPSALGLDPTGWVALAMLAVILLMVWKKVPSAVGKALVPLSPPDMAGALFLLTFDPDAGVRETALKTASSLPDSAARSRAAWSRMTSSER